MHKSGTKRYYIRKTPKGWTVQSWFHGPRPKYKTTGLIGTYKSLESALYWLKKRLDYEAGRSGGWRCRKIGQQWWSR